MGNSVEEKAGRREGRSLSGKKECGGVMCGEEGGKREMKGDNEKRGEGRCVWEREVKME